jgi:hypothetical protein
MTKSASGVSDLEISDKVPKEVLKAHSTHEEDWHEATWQAELDGSIEHSVPYEVFTFNPYKWDLDYYYELESYTKCSNSKTQTNSTLNVCDINGYFQEEPKIASDEDEEVNNLVVQRVVEVSDVEIDICN